MLLDLHISRLREDISLRAQLAFAVEEIDALHDEAAALRSRVATLTAALGLCRTAAVAALRDAEPGNDDADDDDDDDADGGDR